MINIKSILLSVGALSLMASCSDVVHYNDDVDDIFYADGAPVINAIYDVGDLKSENPIEIGSLSQMIRIEGSNLSHVKQISFNGLEVDPSEIYATSKACYVKIPRRIPEVVTNTIKYTTELGSVSIPFEVTIPNLRLEGLANEFARAGESVRVNGDFFDLFGFGTEESGASISIDGKELAIDSLTESYMSIVIPEDTPDNSLITFEWDEVGNRHFSRKVPFRTTRSILMPDLNAVGWWDTSIKKYITDGSHPGDPESTFGNFFRITGHFDQWSWNSFGGGSNWPESFDCRTNPADYVFKFEVCSASSNPFYDSESFGYLFSLNDSQNHCWNPSEGVSFNTYGQWRTISIPLDRILGDKEAPAPGSWGNFCMVFQPNTEGGWNLDHSFANFRIEPANY